MSPSLTTRANCLISITSVSGDAMTIAFDAPTRSFQFEYYDASLDLGSAARRYSFAAAAPYAIQSLVLEVQQPIDATGLQATPALTDVLAGHIHWLPITTGLTSRLRDTDEHCENLRRAIRLAASFSGSRKHPERSGVLLSETK